MNGIRKFNTVTHEVVFFELIHPQYDLPLIPNSIQQLANGNIYVGTNANYLLEINPSTEALRFLKLIESSATNDSSTIIASEENTLIVGFQNKVYEIEVQNDLILKNSFLGNNSHWVLVGNEPFFDKNSSGFYGFKSSMFQYHYFPTINKHLVELPHAGFVIPNSPSPSSFLIQLAPNTVAFFQLKNTKNGLEMDQQSEFSFKKEIQDIHLGNQKIIWLSSYDEIHKLILHEKQFKSHIFDDSSEGEVSVSSIVQNSSGKFFVATKKGIFTSNQKHQFELISLKDKNRIQNKKQPYFKDLWLQNDSILWGVNEGYSPYKINLTNKTFYKVMDDNEYKSKVGGLNKFINIVPKGDHQLILGSLEGLYSYNIETQTLKSENNIIKGVDFTGTTVFDTVENETYLWIASAIGLYGLNKITNQPLKFLTNKKPSFPKGTKFLTLFYGKDYFLWVGTNKGLFKVDQKHQKVVKKYDVGDGLTDSDIHGIQESGNFIWVTTSNGLSKVNQENHNIQNFHKNEGLLDNNFLLKSFYKASDFLFYAGSSSGLISFDPTEVSRSMHNYSVFPVELRYFDRKKENFYSITSNFKQYQTIDLPSPYSSLFFSFAMNDLISPRLNKVFYRISSLSPEWILLDSDATVKLFGLQSGKYTLEVKGASELGSPSQNTLSYTINVPYPFYFQWWFILAAFFLIALVLYLWFYFEATVLKINKDRHLQISNLELKAYQAQMNPHFIFNALNGLQSTMILHGEKEFNNYIGSFQNLLGILLK